MPFVASFIATANSRSFQTFWRLHWLCRNDFIAGTAIKWR